MPSMHQTVRRFNNSALDQFIQELRSYYKLEWTETIDKSYPFNVIVKRFIQKQMENKFCTKSNASEPYIRTTSKLSQPLF